jgi:hypothetical protein
MDAVNSVSRRKFVALLVRCCGAPRRTVRRITSGHRVGIMTADRVDIFALAIGFAIAGCWSLVSGAVVLMGLRAFGITAG